VMKTLSLKYRLLLEQARENTGQVENPALWLAMARKARERK
jgi:hypothetical protein